jgi:hypothetical protein
MKKVKGFSDFIYLPILEKLNVGKYQRSIKKFYKDSDIELYNTSTYSTALTVLIELVEKFMEYGSFDSEPTIDNATKLTIFAVSVLTPESKDKTEKLYEYLLENGISDDDMHKVVNQLKNIQIIFSTITESLEQSTKDFDDMLKYTSLFVPYVSVLIILLEDGLINVDYLSTEFDEFKELITEFGMKLLIIRISRKLNIMTTSTNKFQNKDNVKPLKVNDEFKSPMYKNVDTHLE